MAGNGGYRTKQRELIEGYLQEHTQRHVTAEEIITFLKEGGTPVSKATVYRYLDKMLAQGQVRKYTIDEGMCACYQYVGSVKECHNHYHFKCSKCGKLLHISCERINEIKAHVCEEHGFLIDSSKTVFYGLCAECRKGE